MPHFAPITAGANSVFIPFAVCDKDTGKQVDGGFMGFTQLPA